MRKKVFFTVLLIILVWLAVGFADLFRVHSFNRPIFCIGISTADDGGTGLYAGLGYGFWIEGNFMPDDELPGVTEYTYYLFGSKVFTGIRD